MEIESAEHPRSHHLPGLFIQIHSVGQPKTGKFAEISLVRKWLRGDRWVMLIARPDVFEQPVHGIGRAATPFLLLEAAEQLRFEAPEQLKPLPPP
jgi:hypothetical protein